MARTVTLNNGQVMPTIGLGTDFIHDKNNFHSAIMKDGYRLIDTAAMYKNEETVGEALS